MVNTENRKKLLQAWSSIQYKTPNLKTLTKENFKTQRQQGLQKLCKNPAKTEIDTKQENSWQDPIKQMILTINYIQVCTWKSLLGKITNTKTKKIQQKYTVQI